MFAAVVSGKKNHFSMFWCTRPFGKKGCWCVTEHSLQDRYELRNSYTSGDTQPVSDGKKRIQSVDGAISRLFSSLPCKTRDRSGNCRAATVRKTRHDFALSLSLSSAPPYTPGACHRKRNTGNSPINKYKNVLSKKRACSSLQYPILARSF